MKDLISIIIPVYNVEDYLDRCLKSIVSQEYSNLEIILINDGSVDNSGKICDEWAKADKRIKVIHQNNKGVSAARNAGLDIAKGELIGFVDPDDDISTDMYSSMIENMKKNNADVVACGVSEVFLDGSERIYRKEDKPIKLNKNETIKKALMLSDDIGGVVWDKLWKRTVIDAVRFNRSLSIAEDRLFCISALLNSKVFYRDFKPKYYCIKREKSVTQSEFSKKNFDVVYSAKIVYENVISEAEYYLKEANFHIVRSCMDVTHEMFSANKQKEYEVEYKSILKLLNKISIKKLPLEIGMGFKLKALMLRELPNVYVRLWRMKKMIKLIKEYST